MDSCSVMTVIDGERDSDDHATAALRWECSVAGVSARAILIVHSKTALWRHGRLQEPRQRITNEALAQQAITYQQPSRFTTGQPQCGTGGANVAPAALSEM